MIAFHNQGHLVYSLSQKEGFLIHDFLESRGIKTHSFIVQNSRGWRQNWRNLLFLIRFCKRNRFDIVYSHLEPANFIAAMAQLFIHAKVILCRHHSDQYRLLNRDKDWSYRLTYWLARHIIVFSHRTRDYMIHEESIRANRIIHVNLAYDFSLYPEVRPDQVDILKQEYRADMLLITVGSFLPLKRPETSIHLVKSLRSSGIDVKLILLGSGELEHSLKELAGELGLGDCIFFPGYVQNVLEYMAASTFVIHPSISEASCVCVKEAGIVRRPVIVCRGVGDFDDYILNGENGFLVSKDNFCAEASKIIQRYLADRSELSRIGENLRAAVVQRFGIEDVLPCYNTINAQN